MLLPLIAITIAWAAWVISWIVAAALWSDPAAKRPPPSGDQFFYRFLTFAGAFLLFWSYHPDQDRYALWHLGGAAAWVPVGVALLGFAFTWWARLHLGRLWSSSVTRKADHHVVDTGPYGLVRHPIYTGVITAIFATAALNGAPLAFVGALVMTLGFWIKARLEEKFLREQLGVEAYDSYRRRVPMLVPYGPKSA